MEDKTSPFKMILGSSSIARRKILAEMGYEFTLMSADIDEKAIGKEKPEELVMALAEAKADSIISKLQTINNQEKDERPTILVAADTAEAILQKLPVGDYLKEAEPTLLITSDQVVVYEGAVREKPSSEKEAREFIKGYSGGHAATVGSVVVTNLKTGVRKGEWDRVEKEHQIISTCTNLVVATERASNAYETVVKIYFHEIPDEVIEKLIEEGTVLHVAGGLIIEHPLIKPYVKQVVGTTECDGIAQSSH